MQLQDRRYIGHNVHRDVAYHDAPLASLNAFDESRSVQADYQIHLTL